MPSWFGDFSNLCFSACLPLPTCNLLNETLWRISTGSVHGQNDVCLLNNSPVRDLGMTIMSLFGLFYITFQVLCKSHRMNSAVGRIEMSLLFLTYTVILLLQIFTLGGVLPRSRTFMIWTSAFHLGAIVCFFWTLIVNALILFQFVEDGTNLTTRFIAGSCMAWMAVITFLSLDLAFNITGHHGGRSPPLFFLTLIFPAVAVVLYVVLVIILVFWKLEEYNSLYTLAMALATFATSQAIFFGGSHAIAVATHGRVSGSMFSTLFDITSVALLYKFWRSITDGSWCLEEEEHALRVMTKGSALPTN